MSLITFEGIDGCGKTTIINMVYEWMTEIGLDVVLTKEPGAPGSKICTQLRKIALDPDSNLDKDTAELFIMMADRAQHVKEIIMPALRENKIVLCDRYIDSTVAYQGYGRRLGADLETINKFNNIACRNLWPDLTIMFDIDVKLAMSRTTKSEFGKADTFEQEEVDFFERVAKGFRDIGSDEETSRIIKTIKITEDMSRADVFLKTKTIISCA